MTVKELKQQYSAYKESHKASASLTPSRPVRSLLHFYGERISYNARREFAMLADTCQTFAEADLLASAIIIAMTQ